MLYIIGLGLNQRGISRQGMDAIKKCKKIYLDTYTVKFPYPLEELRFEQKVIRLKREDIESSKLIEEAKSKDIALLVYGSPLSATTHISLILDGEKEKVQTKVIYAGSVFDAIGETGLQLYKFGKTTSMPAWTDEYKPDFLTYVKENKKIKAHSLILVDIGLSFGKALWELEEAAKKEKLKIGKILACSMLGTWNSRAFYGKIEELKSLELDAPFCLIIPGELHFLEEEAISRFSS